MKLELTKNEVAIVVNMRAWAKAFGKMQSFVTVIFLGPIFAAISLVSILTNNDTTFDTTSASICLVIGLVMSTAIPNVLKRFKEAKKEILDNVVIEERGK